MAQNRQDHDHGGAPSRPPRRGPIVVVEHDEIDALDALDAWAEQYVELVCQICPLTTVSREFVARIEKERRGYVYMILAGRHIKIGYSEDPRRRMMELQTSNPLELALLGAWPASPAEERYLHRRLEAHRVQGEWFEPQVIIPVEEFFRHRPWLEVTERAN